MPTSNSYTHSSKYRILRSTEERNSYRFGTTWGWVNDDYLFIFGLTIPLNKKRVAHHSRISSGNKAVAHYSVMTRMFFEWMPTLLVPCSMLLLKRELLGGFHNKWSYTVSTYKTGFVKNGRRDPEGERKGGEKERHRETGGEREREKWGGLRFLACSVGEQRGCCRCRPAASTTPSYLRLLTQPFPVFDLKSLFRTTLLLSSLLLMYNNTEIDTGTRIHTAAFCLTFTPVLF